MVPETGSVGASPGGCPRYLAALLQEKGSEMNAVLKNTLQDLVIVDEKPAEPAQASISITRAGDIVGEPINHRGIIYAPPQRGWRNSVVFQNDGGSRDHLRVESSAVSRHDW